MNWGVLSILIIETNVNCGIFMRIILMHIFIIAFILLIRDKIIIRRMQYIGIYNRVFYISNRFDRSSAALIRRWNTGLLWLLWGWGWSELGYLGFGLFYICELNFGAGFISLNCVLFLSVVTD